MATQVRCPNPACRNHTRLRLVPDELAGKQVGCKVCGETVRVPRPIPWLPTLGFAALALVVAAAVLLFPDVSLPDTSETPDESPQLASLPEPAPRAWLDKRTVAQPTNSEPIAEPARPVSPSQPLEVKEAPPPAQPAAARPETPPESAPPVVPARLPAPEPSPPPRREPLKTKDDAKFIIPFDAVAPVEKLDKIKVTRIEGRFSFANSTIVNPVTMTWQSTARFKWDEKAGASDIAFLIDGNRGWIGDGQKVKPMDVDGLLFYQSLAYSISLSNLVPLREKGFEIILGEDVRVRNADCSVIRVKSQGRPELKMLFDKQTGFLAKAEFRGRFFNVNNLKLQRDATLLENYFSDYRKVAGVNHWQRYEQFRDGKKYCELNLDRVQFFEEANQNWFAIDRSARTTTPGVANKVAPVDASPWRITRVVEDRKAANSARALRVTVMFSTPQPTRAGESFRLLDRAGLILDRATLRFSSSAGRYGTLAFETLLAERAEPLNRDWLFLQDEEGNRAALELGATARKMK